MINKLYFKAICAVSVVTVLNSCVKSDDYSVPPVVCVDKFPATNHSLSELNALAKANPGESDIIKEDYIVEAYVSSTDETGNIYKAVYAQDKPQNPTQGVEIDIDGPNQYTNFPLGSKLRINLKGLVVQGVNNNIKIGPYDPNYPVGRINPNKIADYVTRVCGPDNMAVVAKIVPLEFNTISEALRDGAHANQLVKINQVQFEEAELGKTFADPDRTADRYITDKRANRLDLRFSNYASFATTPISPNYAKSGSITLILSRYTNPYNNAITEQAYIRSLSDIDFTKDRFEPGVPDAPSASATVLFKGADFENWNDFLASLNTFGLLYSKQGVGTGYKGGNALWINDKPTKNDFVFTALNNATLPANPKRITFYIKGVATGKSLSVNVYKEGGSSYYAYNLGTFKNGAMLDYAQTNSYTGSIDTGGEWRLVELSLDGITDINRTAGKSMFAIKVGSAGNYDILIDNIKIE
ncbi:TPA: DUF5689 domain-containing protein [Elizabethkingia meningoseptica]